MHNHPSGDPKMSLGDKMAFNTLFKGVPDVNLKGLGDLMGEFVVIDHGKLSYIAQRHGDCRDTSRRPRAWGIG